MADIVLGKAKVSVVAETEKHDKNIDKSKEKVKGFGKETTTMSSKAKTAWALVGASVVGAVFEMNKAITAASNLEEATSKFNTVFKSQIGLANDWAKELNKSYGQSTREARESLGAIQDLLVPMGMAEKQAGKLSFEVVKLATDLGSFNNKLTPQVIDDYQSALVGNFETMKKYGVVLNATVVSQKALAMGLASEKSELTAANKAMAAHELIVQGSSAAIGDFIRTSDGYANTTKDLDSAWEDFTATLGEDFLPVAADVKQALSSILKEMTEMQKQGKLGQYADTLMLALTGPMAAMIKYNQAAFNFIFGAEEKTKDVNKSLKEAQQENPFGESIDQLELFKKEAVEAQKALDNLTDSTVDWDKIGNDGPFLEDIIEANIKADEFILNSMDKTSEEYKKKWLKMEMSKWEEGKLLSKEKLSEINSILEKSLDEIEEDTDLFFKGITENFTSAIQSELSNVFTDTLTGDLDNFEDYFMNFTDSLAQMWGQMAAQMVMQQALFSLTGGAAGAAMSGAGAAGMLGIGVAVAGVTKFLGDKSEKRAEERARRKLAEQINRQVSDSIAQLELSDLDYEIYKMNESFRDLISQAKQARIPFDDIIKLRRLETQEMIKQSREGYENLSAGISDFITGKQRQDWGVSDWQREFGVLSDDLMSLDQNADDYHDKSLELLTEQAEILQTIYSIQETQLRALESTSMSLVSQAAGLQTAEGMPISREYFEAEYNRLLDAALTTDETGMLNTTDIAFFQGFVNDYIDTMSMLGGDFATLNNQATTDLLNINDAVQSEMEILVKALDMNTEAVEGNTGIIKALSELQDVIVDVSDRDAFNVWEKRNPTADWESIPTYTSDGLNFRYPQLEEAAILMPAILDWLNDADESTKKTQSFSAYFEWANKVSDYIASVEAGGDFSTVYFKDLLGNEPDIKFGLAKGGLVNSTSVIGETGQPEWGVPAYNNTNNANFLKTVGMDRVIESIEKNNNSGAPMQVNVMLDGKVLATAMIDQSRTNPEFKRMLQ